MRMPRDYAKQFRHKPSSKWLCRSHWVGIFFVIGLVGVSLLFFNGVEKARTTQKIETRLRSKIAESSQSKVPEAKFDFYNILSQTVPNSTSQDNSENNRAESSSNRLTPHGFINFPKGTLGVANETPEQIALAEVKKQLEQEVRHLEKVAYVLSLGSFIDIKQAEQIQAKALVRGFSVKKKIQVVNGKAVYQIFIGPYPSLGQAVNHQKQLNTEGLKAILTKVNLAAK